MVTQRTVRQVRRIVLWGIAVLCAALAVYVGTATVRVFGTLAKVRGERVEAQMEQRDLVTRTGELKAAIGALDTPRGLEDEIRSRYPLVKPGEVEFVFVDNATSSLVDSASTTRESIWSSFRAWIGLWRD